MLDLAQMWQPAALRWCALLVSLLLVLHPLSVFSEEHESDYDRIDPHAPLGDDGTQGGTTGREHTEEGHYSAEDERSNETWDDVYYMDFDDYEYMAEKCAL